MLLFTTKRVFGQKVLTWEILDAQICFVLKIFINLVLRLEVLN